jgi:hypothetical protein
MGQYTSYMGIAVPESLADNCFSLVADPLSGIMAGLVLSVLCMFF